MARHRRLRRLLASDGHTVIVTIDHGYTMSVPELAVPSDMVRRFIAGGADAILTTYGLARQLGDEMASVGLIVRLDSFTQERDGTLRSFVMHTVEDALAIGADGVAVMTFPESPAESQTLEQVGRVVSQANRWGVPVLIEALPGGVDHPETNWTIDRVAFAARQASELGADIVKTAYRGPANAYGEAMRVLNVPFVVLGGPSSADVFGMLRSVEEAMSSGASGVAMGRYIWQHPDPEGMTRAVAAVVHEGVQAQHALGLVPSMAPSS